MRAEIVAYLRCPVCDDHLATAGQAVRCGRGHSYDLARQGYLHLGPGRAVPAGDTADMVAARTAFLAEGQYDFLSAALARAAVEASPAGPGRLVIDVGAGTGHHLAAVLDASPTAVGLALDSSKPALRRAARAHERAGAVLCDIWDRIPVADDAASVLLNVFAPRNGAEFARVLRGDGTLLVVTPAPDHLVELVSSLDLLRVDPRKPERLTAGLGEAFTLVGQETVGATLRLTRTQVRALVRMGPSAWHADPDRLARRIAALPEPITVTAAMVLGRYARHHVSRRTDATVHPAGEAC